MKNTLQNIEIIKQRIAAVCTRVGREPEEAKLLLTIRIVALKHIKIAPKTGNTLIAENKIQELKEKYEALEDVPHTNHFTGRLQTNKTKEILCYEVSCVEPVDRTDLAQKLHNRLASEGEEFGIFIQMNTPNEESKFGTNPVRASDLVRQVAQLPTLHIKGLVTTELFSAETGKVRAYFKLPKRLQQKIVALGLPGVDPQELSMGMNGDLETAIEEGATIVCVGTAIFGQRIYPDSYYRSENR